MQFAPQARASGTGRTTCMKPLDKAAIRLTPTGQPALKRRGRSWLLHGIAWLLLIISSASRASAMYATGGKGRFRVSLPADGYKEFPAFRGWSAA